MPKPYVSQPIIFEDKFFGKIEIGGIIYYKEGKHNLILRINQISNLTKENIKIIVYEDSFASVLYKLFESLKENIPLMLNGSGTYNTICKSIINNFFDVIRENAPSERGKSQILFDLANSKCNAIIFKEPIDELGHAELTINSETKYCRLREYSIISTIPLSSLISGTNRPLDYLVNTTALSSDYGNYLCQTMNSIRFIADSISAMNYYDRVGKIWTLLELSDKDYERYDTIDNSKTTYKSTPDYIVISDVMNVEEFFEQLPKHNSYSFGRLVLHLIKE